MNDGPDVLATQRRSELARNEAVHELNALDVPRVAHDLKERAIEWQRALQLRKFGGARLTEQLRLFPIGTLGISGVHPVHVLHDREARSSQRIGEQKCAGVGPVKRDARGRELMMMIRRKYNGDGAATALASVVSSDVYERIYRGRNSPWGTTTRNAILPPSSTVAAMIRTA